MTIKPGCTAYIERAATRPRGDDWEDAVWAYIEFNPSRWADPHGISLCPPERLLEAVEEVRRAVRNWVALKPANEDLVVTRLHVARDFLVRNPAHAVMGLGPLRRPHLQEDPEIRLHHKTGVATSFRLRTYDSSLLAYDKAAEIRHRRRRRNPKGSQDQASEVGLSLTPGQERLLRVEVQARPQWLKRYGSMQVVGDVATGAVDSMYRRLFDWAQMGATYMSQEDLVLEVQRWGLKPGSALAFLQHVSRRRIGLDPGTSRRTQDKYDKLARERGVALGSTDMPVGVHRRLDFELQEEVEVCPYG